ncbi:hypothetical protein COOONC_22101, partial [Cooperia oncophora]
KCLQSLAGDLNIPVPGWGNFDVDGNLYYGNINVDTKVGYQIRPTNKLNIKPETLALLGQSPEFREARSECYITNNSYGQKYDFYSKPRKLSACSSVTGLGVHVIWNISVGRIRYGFRGAIEIVTSYIVNAVCSYKELPYSSIGDDTFFIGGIDLPLPVGPLGSGVRFPLSGAVEAGTSPYAYAHGHAFNPVSPFDLNAIDDDDVTQVSRHF